MGLWSEIRDTEKTYSGSRIQGQNGTRSRIRIRNTGKNPADMVSLLPLSLKKGNSVQKLMVR